MGVLFNNLLDLSDAIVILTDDYTGGFIEYVEFVHYLNEFSENNVDIMYIDEELNPEIVSIIGSDRADLVIDALS